MKKGLLQRNRKDCESRCAKEVRSLCIRRSFWKENLRIPKDPSYGARLTKKPFLAEMEIDKIKTNAKEIKTRFLKPSYNTAVTMMRGSIAMVVRMAKNESCVASPSKMKVQTRTRVTSEKSDEGFEGPPDRQLLEEILAKVPGKIHQRDDANDTSKEENDIEILNVKVEEKADVENLSDKAENRAVQGTSAGVLDSVKSDPKKTGAAKRKLEDRDLGRFVAPERKEPSTNKIKARILGHEAEGRKDAKKPGYATKQMVRELNDKAETNNTQIGHLDRKIEISINKAREKPRAERRILERDAKSRKDQAKANEARAEVQTRKQIKDNIRNLEKEQNFLQEEMDDFARIVNKDSNANEETDQVPKKVRCTTQTYEAEASKRPSFKEHLRPIHKEYGIDCNQDGEEITIGNALEKILEAAPGIIETQDLWDPGALDTTYDTETRRDAVVIKVKPKNVSDINLCAEDDRMNNANQPPVQPRDAMGVPTVNEIRVFTCAGCPGREAGDGPYRWNHQFTYSQDAQVRRTAMRNIAGWMGLFSVNTVCITCMSCVFDIVINILNTM